MSRIQDILAKAERDGTARRTQTGAYVPAAPSAFAPQSATVPPAIDGTSALDTASFLPTIAPAPAPAPAAAPAAEGRTATATLHPLLVSAITPHSPVAEQYRTLRARISQRDEMHPLRTLMITSPGEGDGKSVTAANLALTMAQEFQRRVVLVDADLRAPSTHSLFGLSGAPGLSELISGEASLDDVLVYLPDYRLSVIPAGRTPQFPTELLGSTGMRRVVDTLRGRFDRILLDLPAVMPLADVGTVAPLADGVLMVVRAGVTLRPTLDQALSAFDQEKVLGVVLNGADN